MVSVQLNALVDQLNTTLPLLRLLWQPTGKCREGRGKPRALIETLALHRPCEFVLTGEHAFPLWDGWNNGAVLLKGKMIKPAEPSDTQAYPRINAG